MLCMLSSIPRGNPAASFICLSIERATLFQVSPGQNFYDMPGEFLLTLRLHARPGVSACAQVRRGRAHLGRRLGCAQGSGDALRVMS
jgi:hypothetical protein